MRTIDLYENYKKDLIPIIKDIRLHSLYDIDNEAKDIFDCYYDSDVADYTFVGLAFGYHLRYFLKKNINITIIILDPKIYKLGGEKSSAEVFKSNKNINFIEISDLKITELEKILNDDKRINIYHTPSVEVMVEGQKKNFIKAKKIRDNSFFRFEKIMEENVSINSKRSYKNLDKLMDRIKDKNLMITGAGPSLDEDIKLIKKIRKRIFLLASGTSVKTLVRYKIIPDAVIITDPQVKVIEQIKDVDIKVPLIILNTTSHFVQRFWKGDIFLWRKENSVYEEVESGGSVVTTAFDIAIKSRCRAIILSGVDFSYSNNYSHAKDAHRSNKINNSKYRLKNYDGTYSKTAYNLIIYKKWIEKKSRETNIMVYNITSHGAIIENTIRLTESEILDKFGPHRNNIY
jgi:hypothetical protein